jgi:hypothetical protein
MKRTFVVPDEKEEVYRKFKELVPEVSGKLVEMMEGYVNKYEALQAGMTEQTIHEGTEQMDINVFQGKTFKFYGVLLSKGDLEGFDGVYLHVYLTQKGKFLVTSAIERNKDHEIDYNFSVYESYIEMRDKAKLSVGFIKDCEAYLNKNSTIRTYEVLDV